MKTTCETDAKKLARLRIWSRFAMPQEGKIAILSGPENGDARCLRAKGLDPSRLVCVDSVAKSLESAQAVEPRAAYHHGDFRDALRAYPCAGFFLDECRIASPDAADYLAECASLVPAGAPIAAAYMYGRWPFAGKAPSWKKNHEHWADYFTRECRRAFEARGLAFDCDTVIGYKGKGVPMLAFVGRVGVAGLYRKPRVFWEGLAPAEAGRQVRAWALKDGADLLNVSPATLGAWRAVETRNRKAGYRGRRLTPESPQHAEWLERNRQKVAAWLAAQDPEDLRRRRHERYLKHRDRILARQREYNQTPEARARVRAQAVTEKRREAKRAAYWKNRDKYLEARRGKNLPRTPKPPTETKRARDRAAYAEGGERVKAARRAYSSSEKAKAARRKYQADNAEKIRIARRKYREENAERLREESRNYRADNAERLKANRRKAQVTA